MKKAVFLDRDGVINRKPPEGQYVTHKAEMQFLPGAAQAINLLNRAGFCVVVVTNQRCVARGLLTVRDLELMHQWMCGQLADLGAIIDQVYYCPHDKEPPCNCRKPAPGMLLTAAREHDISLADSWMIGDSDTDIEAGKSIGCKAARLLEQEETSSGNPNIVASSLLDAVQQILLLQASPSRRMRGQRDYRSFGKVSSSEAELL